MPDPVKTRHDKMVAAAVWLAEQGALVGWGAASDGKAVNRKWKSDATDDPALVPGILHGARNSIIVPKGRLVITDIDKYGWYEQLVDAGLPDTFTVESPTVRTEGDLTFRGRHVYALAPVDYDVLTIPGVWRGGETRRSREGEQSMVLGPWSARSDGIYTPAQGTPRHIAEAPAAVFDFIIANAARSGPLITVSGGDDDDWDWDGATMGSRHDFLRDRIRAWRGLDDDADSLKARTVRFIERHHIPLDRPGGEEITDAEIDRMIAGALKKYDDDEVVTIHLRGDEVTPAGSVGVRGTVEVGLLDAPVNAVPLAMRSEAFATAAPLAQLMDHWRPRTDASFESLLVQTLVYAGTLFGHQVTTFYGSREQHSNVFAILVGTTGTSRKGTSADLVRGVWGQVSEAARGLTHSPNSGEGVIRLASEAKGGPVLIYEEEFARFLAAKGRDYATLSPIMRQAFDDVPLSSVTSTRSLRADIHHVSMIAHITDRELEDTFGGVDLTNGFANRMAWVGTFSRPVTVSIHDNDLSLHLRDELRDVIAWVNKVKKPLISGTTHQMTDPARSMLADASATYNAGVGLAPMLSRRLDTIAARLALIYACFDQSHVIEPIHVEAALAVTDYAHATATWLWPATTGDLKADFVLSHLREAGFLNGTALEALIGTKKPLDKQIVANKLMQMGYARKATRPRADGKPGRPQEGLEII